MKLWAAGTVLLYLLVMFLLTMPVVWLCFGEWWGPDGNGLSLKEAPRIYQEAAYWIWLGVIGLCQIFLLFAPVRMSRRLTPRRPLMTPILTTGFLLSNLVLCAIVCILSICFSDKGVMIFAFIGDFVAADAAKMWGLLIGKTGILASPNVQFAFGVVTATGAFWLFWGLIFYGFARTDDPETLIKRSTRWILRGSIAELLVAVPSHVIVRHRHDCCAPVATFWGIATGLSLLLLAFGPGVFFLFSERMDRLKPKNEKL